MATEVMQDIIGYLEIIYGQISLNLSSPILDVLKLFFFAVFISIIAFGIWKFYQTLSKKNFLLLNLSRYNMARHPNFRKFFALLFYFIEYILIMPILLLIWFSILSFVILLIASQRNVIQILMVSGAMIMSIRLLAYCKEELSKELAKLFPFITLSVFLLTPGIISDFNLFTKLKQIPILFNSIIYFFVVILIFEIFLRIIYVLYEVAAGNEVLGFDED